MCQGGKEETIVQDGVKMAPKRGREGDATGRKGTWQKHKRALQHKHLRIQCSFFIYTTTQHGLHFAGGPHRGSSVEFLVLLTGLDHQKSSWLTHEARPEDPKRAGAAIKARGVLCDSLCGHT